MIEAVREIGEWEIKKWGKDKMVDIEKAEVKIKYEQPHYQLRRLTAG